MHKSSQDFMLCYQIASYESELKVQEERLRAELEEVSRRKEEEAAVVVQQAEEEIQRLTGAVTATQMQLSIIQPELKALAREYKALKKQCQSWPQFIQATIKETQKQVSHI